MLTARTPEGSWREEQSKHLLEACLGSVRESGARQCPSGAPGPLETQPFQGHLSPAPRAPPRSHPRPAFQGQQGGSTQRFLVHCAARGAEFKNRNSLTLGWQEQGQQLQLARSKNVKITVIAS